MINGYHDMKVGDQNYKLEVILKNYQAVKKQILNQLKTDSSSIVYQLWNFYLSQDKMCHANCSQCQMISHLSNDIIINEPFMIKTGQTLMLRQTAVRPFLKWTNDQIKGDAVTIKILVTWILEDVLNLPHTINLLTAYICRHNACLLYEVPTINEELCDFERLLEYQYTKDIVYGLLCQIIVLYQALSKQQFSHGRSHINSFLFNKTPCDYTYEYNKKSYHIQCDYTLQLADVSYSSIKYNNHLLFPHHTVVNILCNHFHSQHKQTHTFVVNDIEGIKHTLPLSIDLYLVILSMMENDNFFNTVMENQNCYDLWKNLWQQQEGLVEQRLMNNDKSLTEIKMYVDPYPYLFNYITT